MSLAKQYGADRIWIVNVGHFKGYEFPLEYFMNLAWNTDRWGNTNFDEFTRLWAEREFGAPQAAQIADIVSQYTQFNGRRKPELLDPETFSQVDYQEADRVVAGWESAAASAEAVAQKLPANRRDAFFELVLYPVKACANLNELYAAAAQNRLCAAQGRASANQLAAQVKTLFQADAALSDYYNHTLAGGRWDHMMDQTHIGYTYWQQPESNAMPRVVELQVPEAPAMGVAVEGSTEAWPGSMSQAVLPSFDAFNQPSRYLDVFNRGKSPFQFSAASSAPWIALSCTNGTVDAEKRLWVSVDWKAAPAGRTRGAVTLSDGGTNPVVVAVNVFNPPTPSRESAKGFVEADGCVSIEAEHFTRRVDAAGAGWKRIDGLGNTLSAMTIFPVTAASVTPPKSSPRLEYRMFLFHAGEVKVESILSPTLNFVSGRGLRFAVSFDDQVPRIVTAVPADFSLGGGDGNRDWEQTVRDGVRKVTTAFTLQQPGEHTLKFWMVDPGVALQKIVVDLGGVKPSYLGPPESFHR
jgi:hypothetical protein